MIRVTWQRARFLTLFWALWCTFAIAQNTTDATKNYHDLKPGVPVSFAKQVAPILQAKCVGCHSQTSSMGGLVLSDFASLMKGGSHGPAVVPGNGKDSRMVQMLEGNVQPRMPMGAQLDPLEIASINSGSIKAPSSTRIPANCKPCANLRFRRLRRRRSHLKRAQWPFRLMAT